jgi:hypothetical protein
MEKKDNVLGNEVWIPEVALVVNFHKNKVLQTTHCGGDW